MSLCDSFLRWALLAVFILPSPVSADLALPDAVKQALAQDLWQNSSLLREKALSDRAVASGALPDPRVTLSAGNFPVDSFDIRQEPMTQLSVAVTQMFPRGRSRELSEQQTLELSSEQPLLRQNRDLAVEQTVTSLWLSGWQAQESIALAEQERALFRQLVEAAQVGYSSGLGATRQQDVLSAEVELARLEDRLAELQQSLAITRQQLVEWLGYRPGEYAAPPTLPAPDTLPTADTVSGHPQVLAFERRIRASETGIALARQAYKPSWGVTAKYGYREDDLMGNERADLMSVGVTFEVPLFTGNRQDRQVSAAVSEAEALRTEKALLLRQFHGQLAATLAEYKHLYDRRRFYQDALLPQAQQQASAALSAYNNDQGDFTSAVSARTVVLNTRLNELKIEASLHRALSDVRYLSAHGSRFEDVDYED